MVGGGVVVVGGAVVVVVVVEVVVVVRGAGRFAHAGETNSVMSMHDDRSPRLTTFRRIGAFHHTESRLQGADDAVQTRHSAHRSTIHQTAAKDSMTREAIGRLMKVPLSQKHRSTIFQKLEPILGEEEAEALLSQFPARDLDEPVTREFVRAELADLRVEMHRLANRMLVSMSAVTIAAMGIAVTLARLS